MANWKPQITTGWTWETLEAKTWAHLQLTPTERYRRALEMSEWIGEFWERTVTDEPGGPRLILRLPPVKTREIPVVRRHRKRVIRRIRKVGSQRLLRLFRDRKLTKPI